MGLLKTLSQMSTLKKIGLGVAGVGAVAGGVALARRFFKGRKSRTKGVARLRQQVQRIKLKRLKLVEEKKLFREQVKV